MVWVLPEYLKDLGLDAAQGVVRLAKVGRPMAGSLSLRGSSERSVTFDHVEFAIRGGSDEIHFTNAAQAIPFTFDCTVRISTDGPPIGTIHYTSNAVGWSAHWLERQQSALALMAGGCQFFFKDSSTGIEHLLFAVTGGRVEPPDSRYLEIVRQLAWVEGQVKEPIIIPSRLFFTSQDRKDLDYILGIVRDGQVALKDAKFTIIPVAEHRAELMRALKKGCGESLIRTEWSFWPLLDNKIALGPASLHGPGSQIVPTLPLQDALLAIEAGDEVEVEVKPGKKRRLLLRYDWWYRRRHR